MLGYVKGYFHVDANSRLDENWKKIILLPNECKGGGGDAHARPGYAASAGTCNSSIKLILERRYDKRNGGAPHKVIIISATGRGIVSLRSPAG
ncbi:hypothetical protein EVAR_47489_1 [Eumeta japonica]|uniref:Uncharacterized protein n=1 Tax=Eumeta variegata TaxID=151549 RepID=A0A4C1XAA3_EUMVA|nr:hypothetical protein EVAR_47489_1 [Eumeta japonica]